MFARGVSTRHKDVRFQTSPGGVGRQRAAGISGGRNRKFLCAEVLCHRNGNAHPAGLETLSRVQRFVFHPKIDLIRKSGRAQQRRASFA